MFLVDIRNFFLGLMVMMTLIILLNLISLNPRITSPPGLGPRDDRLTVVDRIRQKRIEREMGQQDS